MRDRNLLTYQKFHIQLEKFILQQFDSFATRRTTFSQDLSLEFRPCGLHREFRIYFPRDFRTLRTLSIVQWYFPENLHYLVLIEMENLTLNWLNPKEQIEIKTLIYSKDSMLRYLFFTDRYSGNEIYGNILGNDLRELNRTIRIRKRKYPEPTEKVYRRGPKDKGSRRVSSLGANYEADCRSDVFLLETETLKSKRKLRTQTIVNRILETLERFQI